MRKTLTEQLENELNKKVFYNPKEYSVSIAREGKKNIVYVYTNGYIGSELFKVGELESFSKLVQDKDSFIIVKKNNKYIRKSKADLWNSAILKDYDLISDEVEKLIENYENNVNVLREDDDTIRINQNNIVKLNDNIPSLYTYNKKKDKFVLNETFPLFNELTAFPILINRKQLLLYSQKNNNKTSYGLYDVTASKKYLITKEVYLETLSGNNGIISDIKTEIEVYEKYDIKQFAYVLNIVEKVGTNCERIINVSSSRKKKAFTCNKTNEVRFTRGIVMRMTENGAIIGKISKNHDKIDNNFKLLVTLPNTTIYNLPMYVNHNKLVLYRTSDTYGFINPVKRMNYKINETTFKDILNGNYQLVYKIETEIGNYEINGIKLYDYIIKYDCLEENTNNTKKKLTKSEKYELKMRKISKTKFNTLMQRYFSLLHTAETIKLNETDPTINKMILLRNTSENNVYEEEYLISTCEYMKNVINKYYADKLNAKKALIKSISSNVKLNKYNNIKFDYSTLYYTVSEYLETFKGLNKKNWDALQKELLILDNADKEHDAEKIEYHYNNLLLLFSYELLDLYKDSISDKKTKKMVTNKLKKIYKYLSINDSNNALKRIKEIEDTLEIEDILAIANNKDLLVQKNNEMNLVLENAKSFATVINKYNKINNINCSDEQKRLQIALNKNNYDDIILNYYLAKTIFFTSLLNNYINNQQHVTKDILSRFGKVIKSVNDLQNNIKQNMIVDEAINILHMMTIIVRNYDFYTIEDFYDSQIDDVKDELNNDTKKILDDKINREAFSNDELSQLNIQLYNVNLKVLETEYQDVITYDDNGNKHINREIVEQWIEKKVPMAIDLNTYTIVTTDEQGNKINQKDTLLATGECQAVNNFEICKNGFECNANVKTDVLDKNTLGIIQYGLNYFYVFTNTYSSVSNIVHYLDCLNMTNNNLKDMVSKVGTSIIWRKASPATLCGAQQKYFMEVPIDYNTALDFNDAYINERFFINGRSMYDILTNKAYDYINKYNGGIRYAGFNDEEGNPILIGKVIERDPKYYSKILNVYEDVFNSITYEIIDEESYQLKKSTIM